MADRTFGFDTLSLHAGQIPDAATGSRAVPIYQTTSYVFDSAEHAASLFNLQTFGNVYSRLSNPTVAVLEERIAALEGGRASVATGSGMAAQMIALLNVCEAGDQIVAAKTLYGGTHTQLGVNFKKLGIETVFVDASDPENFARAITPKTKMIIFSSPCNPSGSVMSESELLAWKNVLIKYPNIFILSDEIYEKINYAGKHCSLASYPELEGRIAVINGMSKGYAMTGWRMGYLAGPKELVQACDKIQGLMTSGASSVSQMASVAALDGPQDEVEVMRTTFEKRRNIFHTALSLIPNLPCNRPDGAFYLFPDVSYYLGGKTPEGKTITTADELCLYLLDKGHVSAVSGEAFGHANCIRFSYAAAEEQLIEAAERIAIAFRNLTH